MKLKLQLSLVTCCSVLLIHCGIEEAPGNLSSQQQAIINGTIETSYLGVGALLIDQGGGFTSMCTGTSVAPGWVLTAAHCVAGANTNDILFTTDHDINSATNFYNVTELHLHHSYTPPGPGTQAENDIALVEVLGLDTPNYAYNTNTEAVQGGLSITWVGYGLNDATPPSGDGVKRTGSGTIEEPYWSSYVYYYSAQMPCSGDSSAPAFAMIGGSLSIVGVVSAFDENCSEMGVDTRVDYYQDWIANTIDGSHEEPSPDADGGEPDADPDAGSDAGTQDDDLPDAGGDTSTDAGSDPGSDPGPAQDEDITPDAGQEEPTPGDDTQPQDTTGPDEDTGDSSSGCSCSTGTTSSSSILTLLALFLLIQRRKRS